MDKSQIKTESFRLAFEHLKFLKELGTVPSIRQPEELFEKVRLLAQKYEREISSTQADS